MIGVATGSGSGATPGDLLDLFDLQRFRLRLGNTLHVHALEDAFEGVSEMRIEHVGNGGDGRRLDDGLLIHCATPSFLVSAG